ncbi:MAG TPA: hypothetical protein DCG54_06525 [Anaerolineae bacterium]|jgi:hypothetical protein|nr:hypothetical protein [Anaerolineae bacterium]
MRAVKERMNLYITKSVADELRRLVPARERTKFVEEVLARELRREHLREVLARTAGAWKDEDHPDLMTVEDINRWIDEQRRIGAGNREEELNKLWGRDNDD